ncbi:CHAD domain-containing protein [Candidatus Ferrigenium straubiae]|jgi:inorganic triphosphatase YgiF|uniref:CYTH and CHAD domain-containing protein n=1 Tax=Candidatus Ferrigenium straubiae TaxID=2919506 RepID=UPI003F4AA375
MAVETELKLRIAPEQLARLKRHPLLGKHQIARPATRRLYNIYYDTPKLELRESGMALRLRRAGRQWLQTLKGGGSVQAGLHRRDEWEIPVSRAALDFSSPQTAEWEEHLPPRLHKKLQPVFVTDFSRTSRMLEWQGAQIELCMDHGEVRTEQHGTPICELELELKSGEPRQLFELALALLEIASLELESVSKAEQGYRLLADHVEKPVKGAAPSLARTATLAEALQTLIWSCLLHLQSNLRGAMTSDDAEYLHQMRVALRRLRVVLRLAGKFRADEVLSALSQDVAALCVALGRIREWDVFIAETMRPMCARMAGHAGLQALLVASERQRAACYAELRGTEQARELQRLMLRFALWMSGEYWQLPQDATAPPLPDFAARHLRKLAKRFEEAGRQLDSLNDARLHALRIVAKKLRYSAEFFAAFFDKQKTGPFLSALSEVQDTLGQINDVAVAHRLLDELAVLPELAAHQEAVALAKGWIAHGLSRQLDILRKAIRHFERQEEFWGRAR